MPFNEALQEIVPQLTAAVEVMMTPTTPQAQRLEAYKACEQFKETSAQCAPCGILMSSKENAPLIRHFGFQLLEHCIKFRWNTMDVKEKVCIKEEAMKLMREGTNEMLVEESHIKDALSRIIVEMMKREWPQQWPGLMDELDEICECGPTQTELVLLVFLRVAEDVAIFQTVPTKRKREMMVGLTASMPALFAFFLKTLGDNFNKYKEMKQSTDPLVLEAAQVPCRVAQIVLRTLGGFLDWVATPVMMDGNGLLLQLLCLMLDDEHLHLDAAECLLIITSRKGKVEDRKPLLILFSEDAMNTILNAVMKTSTAKPNEKNYLFLKRLCQVLTTLGSQLCALWGTTENVSQPPNFGGYLKVIQAFSEHPSQVIGSLTQSLWASFLHHQTISLDPVLLSFIPAIAQVCKSAFLKVGFPSQDNCPSCGYSRFDFDSDEDFNLFYTKYRAEVTETLRSMTLIAPMVTFSVMAAWLDERLAVAAGGEEMSTITSSTFLDWEALTVFMENVMARLHTSPEPKPPAEEGIRLAKAVLFFETKDPLVLSCILSCISALSPYITDNAELLKAMLAKIFSTAVFNVDGQTKATRSRAVKNVRRHACSVLVKTCKRYPKPLLEMFNLLYSHVLQLSSDPEELSQMEKVTLMEALVLISNGFKDFEKQGKFIGEILTDVSKFWLSVNFRDALNSIETFITYIGIDQPPVEPSSTDTCGINRSHMTYCINTIVSVMKRSQWPQDREVAKQCGYMIEAANGQLVLRNPAFLQIGVMLQNVLLLLRTLNALWLPEHLARRHADFGLAYEPAETDKLALLGLAQPPTQDNKAPANRDPLARMQNFITTSHETCYHIMGNAGSCLGVEFYALPTLAQFIQCTVFTNLGSVPNHRLRPLLRVFLKPYIQACPTELQVDAVLPLLAVTCPFMLERLDGQWVAIAQREESRVNTYDEEEDPASQEVLEDQLVRLLTRDYLELLGAVCLNRRGPSAAAPDGQQEESMMEDTEGAYKAQQQQPANNKEDTLSELGHRALESEGIAPSLIISVFNGLTWGDGPTCTRCAILAIPILKYMMSAKRLSVGDVGSLFTAILMGLQKHGEHDGCEAALISLALQAYELLRPEFAAELGNILLQVPNSNQSCVKQFDEKLNKPISDKRKRELFRKLVEEIIGKSVSQRFKLVTEIKDLPPLYKRAHAKPALLDAEMSDLGLSALFKPEPNFTIEEPIH